VRSVYQKKLCVGVCVCVCVCVKSVECVTYSDQGLTSELVVLEPYFKKLSYDVLWGVVMLDEAILVKQDHVTC
jgi:hypothetical protein